MNRTRTVVAVASGESGTERMLQGLLAAGFSRDDVSVLYAEPAASSDLVHDRITEVPDDETVEVVTGSVVGGGLGLLPGIGGVRVPGFGPLIGAGPLVEALVSAPTGRSDLTGALVSFGLAELEAHDCDVKLRHMGALVLVHVDGAEWEARARAVLGEFGAEWIGSGRSAFPPSPVALVAPAIPS